MVKKTRGGVGVVTAIMATIMAAMSGIIGGEIVFIRIDCTASNVEIEI